MSQAKDNTNCGWIKIHRSILDHWIYEKADYFWAWINFIFKANWKPKKWYCNGSLITIDRGSFVSSELQLASDFGWSRGKIRAFIAAIESDGMVTTKRTGNYTTYAIANYEKYQANTQVKEKSQPTDSTADSTEKSQLIGHGNDTTKEVKKERSKEYIYYPDQESPIRFTQPQLDYFLKTWGKAEFHYWVGKLRGWADESPAKFSKKKRPRQDYTQLARAGAWPWFALVQPSDGRTSILPNV